MKTISFRMMVVLLLCAFVLAACAPVANQTSTATQAPASGKPVTLEFWEYASMATSGFGVYTKAMIAEFESSHPNVTINVAGKNDDDLLAGLITSAASGTLPDVFVQSTASSGELLAAGAVSNIYDRWMAMPESYRSQFLDENIAMVTPESGVMYAVPYTGYGTIIYRNLTVLRNSGIDPSVTVTTMDDWLKDFKKISDAGFNALPDGSPFWYGIVSIYAGIADNPRAEWGIDFKNNKTLINEDAYAKTAEFLIKAKPYTSKLEWDNQASTDQFIANQLAYYPDGAWMDPTFQDAKKNSGLDYDYALLPGVTADKHGGCSGYEMITINTKGPNADLAWEFLTFMTSKEAMTKMALDLGQLNANNAAMTAASTNPLIAISQIAAKGQPFNSPPFFIEPYPAGYISTMQDNMVAIYNGEMTPADGAKKLITDLNLIIANRNK